jgi:hypothetical protein
LAQAPQWQDKDAEPAVEMADADPELE